MQFLMMLSAIVAFTVAENIVYYTTKDDYLDMDAVMKDPVRVKDFVDCFIDRAPCDDLNQSYKVHIPESILTACNRCNDAQKHLANRFYSSLKVDYPQYYAEYQEKYDPQHIYLPLLEKAVAAY